ncbi:MAG: glycerate 2-kinase [Sulfurimonas sp.]|jgi:glycerate 2-kinase
MQTKTLAKKIFTDALQASLPKNFIPNYCHLDGEILKIGEDRYKLDDYKNIYVFGSGKAAFTMAHEVELLLGKRVKGGLIVAPKTSAKLKYIEVCEGTHPLPSKKSFDSTQKLIQSMKSCDEDDLYIYLLSGGSSALIELPTEPITLQALQDATKLMLHNALDIQDVNTVRKHISQIKGGKLAQACKASGIVLVLSDIIGDDLYSIGSAPMYGDKSTYEDAINILDSKSIFHHMPLSIQLILQKGVNGILKETPKYESANLKHYIIASNTQALDAAAKSAILQGLSVKIIKEPMQGNVDEMVEKMLEIVKTSKEKCLLFGGECTVKVTGNGQGGRNQHAVALMLKEMKTKNLDICFLSAGTDGIDGDSDAAGAVVDRQNVNIEMQELDAYIQNFDTYNLFKKIDSLVMTGPSGTNVIDIAIIIKGE